ncbi:aliphatic sulfonate ABC transporter substrate-binding protein [Acinetobacter sp. ANC 3813]|uniref:aliphatic sulfonate ABC transporter substrate-binding protein n=1 Tax=Acinetobacter sp. ANC 3813 TaxID=1977873 RepID=UPI000A333DFF|nr:aliphatic sulfonate ABC transporter substrate-binding protein [Acinetobacter sp. ANC 3813]OTG85786.1 sulfonate ABC transporter substrate-binding protein [Acinetobacter sp. ANC 3813]
MKHIKTITSLGLVTLSLALSACQKENAVQNSNTETAAKDDLKKVRIGFQKSSLTLLVARDEKLIEQQFPHAQIEWKEFPAGPQLLEALAVGAVDYGAVGNTPPIFAQAAGKDLNYVGYEVYGDQSLALVVPPQSPIQNISQLKGKRIALQKGSNAHEFLSKILAKAGLTWADIQPIWLPPADARAAFDKQSVDAWAIWDPFLAAAEVQGQARVITQTGDFDKTYAFYMANPKFIAAHPQATASILKALNESDQWIVSHQQVALDIYQKNTGLAPEVAKKAFERRVKPAPIQPLSAEVIQAQQNIADEFFKLKLIPNTLHVQPIVWTPPASH